MKTKGNNIWMFVPALCAGFALLILATPPASAVTITAGSGTLTFSVKVVDEECSTLPIPRNGNTPDGAGEEPYFITTFSAFSYTVSGTTTNLGGTVEQIVGPGANGTTCPAKSYPPITWYISPVFPFTSQPIVTFTPSSNEVGEGSATVGTGTPGILYPQYQIQSIIYDTPGDKSSNGFLNTLTDGTTTSIGSSFQAGQSFTFTISGGFLGVGSTLSWNYGNSITTGNAAAVTNTISDATGVATSSNANGLNTISHQGDLFIIWLNPAVVTYQAGPASVGYSTGTQLLATGEPEIQDQVEVYAGALMANAAGNTSVPLGVLEPQVVDNQTLPGLAGICASKAYYPNKCATSPNQQCGCIPSDFASILTHDPLLNYTSTESPLNADTSGATVCACPTSSSKCRYVPVPVGSGSCVQETELLSGPDEVGGPNPINTFTQSDTTQTTQTYSESLATTLGYSWEQMVKPFGTGYSLKSATQFTWTDSESTGKINGEANSMTVSLSSNTVDCYQHIPIFEDTEFHTFVFQQPAGDTSCLIGGK